MKNDIKLEDASILLNDGFKKILKLNLNTDEFYILALEDVPIMCKFSEWVTIFVDEGRVVHKEEEEDFLMNMDVNHMRVFFNNLNNSRYAFKYHRKSSRGVIEYVECSITRSIEYTDEEPIVIICVKKIDDYAAIKYRSEYDQLTGLKNRWSYDEFCCNNKYTAEVGFVYADLNDLKEYNDTKGHAAGDELLRSFSAILREHFRDEDTYRIGGDEFIIIANNIPDNSFYFKLSELLLELKESGINVALGVYWMVNGEILDGVKEAERRMYEDKRRKKHV